MTKQQGEAYQSIISKPEVSFWVPILVSVITITLSYGVLMTRVTVLENKVDDLLASQNRFFDIVAKGDAKNAALDLRVTALETVNTILK